MKTTTPAVSTLVMNHPAFVRVEPCWVSVYRESRHYGGAEEGGWWYTRTALVGSVAFLSREEAEAYLATAEKQAAELQHSENANFRRAYLSRYGNAIEIEDDFCAGETCSADEYEVVIEEVRGERDNTREEVPHWE
jgi:hypothetical protein